MRSILLYTFIICRQTHALPGPPQTRELRCEGTRLPSLMRIRCHAFCTGESLTAAATLPRGQRHSRVSFSTMEEGVGYALGAVSGVRPPGDGNVPARRRPGSARAAAPTVGTPPAWAAVPLRGRPRRSQDPRLQKQTRERAEEQKNSRMAWQREERDHLNAKRNSAGGGQRGDRPQDSQAPGEDHLPTPSPFQLPIHPAESHLHHSIKPCIHHPQVCV
ncbi:uncharacterized protein [Gorilla gorilla gorilla]|uniref:uncharacterized protein n=1 Tax=Gorilla gorilla gorilla TaxID=9595 RepID=UPI0024465B8D|nr:uncharacterized protein LOC129529030 [Gorilla gorilla gorilla]